MRLSLTLSKYLAKHFLTSIGLVIFGLMSLVFVVDFVETLRKWLGREGVEFTLLLQLSMLKMPGLAITVIPFVMLFSGIWTFTRLTRNNELVIARAAGVSVWQFLSPALAMSFLIGAFVVTLFNPLAAAMSAQHERLLSRYIDGKPSQLSVSLTGLWIRQVNPEGQSVFHAEKVGAGGLEMEQVILFQYDPQSAFTGRIDAKSAVLHFDEAWYTAKGEEPVFHPEMIRPTSLTLREIEESFASPDTISFWKLPRFIELAKTAGFSALKHRLHWHSILSTPILLCAMILIAATFSLRFSRLGGTSQLILMGVSVGFALYFISNLTEALGLSGSLPVALAAWAPAGVAVLLGTALLFHLEDG